MAGALGLIAGGGDLPPAIADSAQAAGRAVFIVGLRGSAGAEIERFDHDWASLGEAGRAIRLLKEHGCSDVLLVGRVARPRFSDLKLDGKGMLVVAKVAAAALKGDDALLRSLVDILEGEGFRAVSVAEAAPALLAREGALGKFSPSARDMQDMSLAVRTVRTLGALDIGQAAAACGGVVLAVEAAEGTDAMIARIATLPENLRGRPGKPEGVLVKAAKPTQDGKTDLPVIGVQTVKNVAAGGLAGIAIEAGTALIINRSAVIAAADEAGVFVYGFARDAFRES
jgi:UDP-2,3-diacylglucosamine hydrolase